MLTPHSIIHGNAGFAYFNKIWGIPVPVSYQSLEDAKKVRILAVADAERSPLYKNTPTFRENGIDLVIGAFHGVFVPNGTPPAIINKLADALEQAMHSKEVQASMENAGAGLSFLRDAAAKDFLSRQDATYSTIIDKLGLRVAPDK
jgi:tripartite-type tricarboxylate transporter receptor subunit TctC